MQQPTLQVHGSSNNDNVFMVDGVQIQHIGFGGNQTGFYFNDGLMEEISYQTSSLPGRSAGWRRADQHDPARRRQHVPRHRLLTGANSSMQADNLSQDLVGARLQGAERGQERLRRQRHARRTDQAAIGSGSSARVAAGARTTYLGNTFTSTGEQAVDDQHITDCDDPPHVAGDEEEQVLVPLRPQHQMARPPAEQLADGAASTTRSPTSSRRRSSTTSARSSGRRRSATACSPKRRCSRCRSTTRLGFEPDAAPERVRDVRPDQVGDQRRLAAHGHQQRADVHVRGKRVVRHRVAQPQGRDAGADRLVAGALHHPRRHPADHQQRRAELGAPGQHAERPQGRGRQQRRSTSQDSWRIGRVDAEPGPPLRALRHVDSRRRARRPARGCRRATSRRRTASSTGTPSRRASASSWDVFGDGRTAVKGGVSRYDRLEGVTIIQPLNQRNISFQTCPWTDTNGDLTRAEQRNRVRELQRLAAADARQRRSEPEAAAPVGIHGDGAAPGRQQHLRSASATTAAGSATSTRRSTPRCRRSCLHAGDDHQPARRVSR